MWQTEMNSLLHFKTKVSGDSEIKCFFLKGGFNVFTALIYLHEATLHEYINFQLLPENSEQTNNK